MSRLKKHFIPNRVLVVVDENLLAAHAGIILPVREKTAIDGKATAFVCENGICALPTCDPDEFARQLQLKKSSSGSFF